MYFESKRYVGVGSNRHGVILAKAETIFADRDFWPRDWTERPIRKEFRSLESEVRDEMIDEGYIRQWKGNGEFVWRKPSVQIGGAR
jgi:hypothetical protein